jgi:hypothetical protein
LGARQKRPTTAASARRFPAPSELRRLASSTRPLCGGTAPAVAEQIVAGAVIMALAGGVRILQIRHAAKRQRTLTTHP